MLMRSHFIDKLQIIIYTCEISCVVAPPYATTVPDHVTARRGASLRVQCIAHGSHPISFQWSRVGGAAISSGAKITKEGVLAIAQLKVTDSGTYRCVATNHVGNSETFAIVTVRGKAGVTSASHHSKTGKGNTRTSKKCQKLI